MMSATSPPKPRVVWREDETRILLKSWKNHLYINRLIKKGCSKEPLYYAISKDLQKYGFQRSLKEIMSKTKNLCRHKKAGLEHFKYHKEVDEIQKMDSGILTVDNSETEGKPAAEPQIVHTIEQQDSIVLDGSVIEEIGSEKVQVIRLSVPDHQEVVNSSASSYNATDLSEPKVQNGVQCYEVNMPQTAADSNSQETSQNILSRFFQEFERSNQQLEKNDAAMLELFREQNDIFRTQTTLLMKLLLK